MARFDLQEFKKQASFFLREKLNGARLALTDVSRIQLLTEEATNEDSWGPEMRTMAMLADAAFELEEYERIVQVIHCRLETNKKRPWRQLYKTLVVLEYLLIHGPNSLEKDLRGDVSCLEELSRYNFRDQQGFDRGAMVQKKADRVLELLNNPDVRKDERTRARKVSFGIQGFGSSMNQEAPQNEIEDMGQQSRQGDSKEVYVPSNKSSEETGNAAVEAPQLGQNCVAHKSCLSMSLEPTQDIVSSNSLSGGVVLPMSQPSKAMGQMKKFKKCLSSPGYFRESLPHLSRQVADDAINKVEEVNTSLLDAVEERDFLSCDGVQEETEEPITEEVSTDEGSMKMASHGNTHSILENIDTVSLAENCKPSMCRWGGEQSCSLTSFHYLPRPVSPNLRTEIQHQWQPPSLIDCNIKFGKAA